MSPDQKEKPELSEHEAEALIKGMGREASVVVHDNGLVAATAIIPIHLTHEFKTKWMDCYTTFSGSTA